MVILWGGGVLMSEVPLYHESATLSEQLRKSRPVIRQKSNLRHKTIAEGKMADRSHDLHTPLPHSVFGPGPGRVRIG
jgi:hypothetical protein